MTAPALRAYAYWQHRFARSWQSSVITTLVTPALYLAAMGVGLGTVVDHGTGGGHGSLGGVRYLDFIGPGLLASTAMTQAASEATFPVVGAVLWEKQYPTMLATPLRVVDVLRGHVLWMAARVAIGAAAYVAVLACFGVLHGATAVLAWPAAVLTGLAFATPLAAFSAGRDGDIAFPLVQRLGIVPLMLFSGAFFPVSQLPRGLQVLARATPLWHGTELCRAAALGSGSVSAAAVHVAYLVALTAAGFAWAHRVYGRRLAT